MANKLGKLLFKTAGLLSLAGYQIYQNKALRTTSHELHYPDLPQELDQYRIVHISDLHGAEFGRDNRRLAQQIKELEPDILCITGDMVHGYSDPGDALVHLIAGLDDKLVKLFVSGNHETVQRTMKGYQRLNRTVLYRKLENYNVMILDGKSWVHEHLPIAFSGMPDRYEDYQGLRYQEEDFDPGDLLPKPLPDRFNVALVHRPNYFRSIAGYGYGLMLSGHTHGGIIRIRGMGGVLSPDRTFFPELDKGIYHKDGAYLHVSSGLGMVKPIPRIDNLPEIALLVLRKGEGDLSLFKKIKKRKNSR